MRWGGGRAKIAVVRTEPGTCDRVVAAGRLWCKKHRERQPIGSARSCCGRRLWRIKTPLRCAAGVCVRWLRCGPCATGRASENGRAFVAIPERPRVFAAVRDLRTGKKAPGLSSAAGISTRVPFRCRQGFYEPFGAVLGVEASALPRGFGLVPRCRSCPGVRVIF